MNYKGKKGLRVDGKQVWHEGNFNPDNKSDKGHKHSKSEITDMPTKLSQFQNDLVIESGGTKIITSATEPAGLKVGDQWHRTY